jgi:RNA polymerase sigma factor (sigma-70 family)
VSDFHTTHWSVVLAARGEDTAVSRDALSQLCGTYWYPLYAYARRRGLRTEEAEDGVQGFFASFLQKGWAGAADPERGRFRTWLLTAFRRHLGHERDRARAVKRGGDRTILRLDFDDGERRYSLEPAHVDTPERLFDRRWALTVLDRALAGLREEMRRAGREDRLDALRSFLPGAAEEPIAHREAAERLGITENAAKVAVHRLRTRYRDRLRAEIAETVARPEDVDPEIQDLLRALAGPAS